jgi:hypothetical protein
MAVSPTLLNRAETPALPVQPLFPGARLATAKTNSPLCTLVVDAEEDFDWLTPVAGTVHSTECMHRICDLHEILRAYGIVPAYLLTYPVLQDPEAVRTLRHHRDLGQCILGVQLHSWVNPPFGGADRQTSFSGNLDAELEECKLLALKERFVDCFGDPPLVFRAGRYGLGHHTPALLEKHGFHVDTSVAPRTTFEAEGGPDFSEYDYHPFWFGQGRALLEIPLCRSVVGWGGPLARALFRTLSAPRISAWRSLMTRSRCAERITLSPEGNDLGAMYRLVRHLCARGHTIFPLSFHSSSLHAGRNPYVRSRAELHLFYDRLSGILDHLLTRLSFTFVDILQVPDFLADPPRARPLR